MPRVLDGLTLVLTGKLEALTRPEAEERPAQCRGECDRIRVEEDKPGHGRRPMPAARRIARGSLMYVLLTNPICSDCWMATCRSWTDEKLRGSPVSGYMTASREDDPVHTVRTIARIAQILIELRDEYVARPRADTLVQFRQRLDDMLALRDELAQRAEHHCESPKRGQS